MAQYLYEMPIRFSKLMKGRESLPTCDLKKSIAQNIFLLITSRHREHRFDETYGCAIWDLDFELVDNENRWLEQIRKSVYNSVSRHEPRLDDISVDIEITLDDQVSSFNFSRSVKKRLTIYVKGTIATTGEEFPFSTNIYLSPLSLD